MMLRKLMIGLLLIVAVTACKKDAASNNPALTASSIADVAYGSDPLQKMDVYLPANRSASSTKVMILIHGGAWALGDKVDFAAFVDSLKKRLPNYAIFNINYRLATLTANHFPAQEMDVKAAVEFIYSKRSDYIISDNFTLVGASAGAQLGLLHAYKNTTPVKIKLVADFFGPTDMEQLYNEYSGATQANLAAVIGATPAVNPALYQQSSPINYVNITAACPTIILQGSADPLVNAASQSGALRNKLLIANVPVKYVEYAGKGHGDDWGSDTYFDAFNNIQTFIATHNP